MWVCLKVLGRERKKSKKKNGGVVFSCLFLCLWGKTINHLVYEKNNIIEIIILLSR